MRITIDGKPADITLENEKTVGEVIAALENWLAGSGLVLNGISVDGVGADSAAVESVFHAEVAGTGELALTTTPQAYIALEAIREAEELIYGEDAAHWTESSAAGFLREKERALYTQIEDARADKSTAGSMVLDILLQSVIIERERELASPARELLSLEEQVNSLTERLENFALDLQLGKDRYANETIVLFAALSAKLFRMLPLLRCCGVELEKLDISENFFIEFNAVLEEFFNAYEEGDTVLSGDIAEYEVAPRMKELYRALRSQPALTREAA